MTFIHPLLLWLLPLALIPVLLHLLTLYRLKTVELSTYRFLFDSYVQQRRRMKFLEALLAMLRTLFLLGLVLAMCRPVVRHWSTLFKSGSGREVVMLVDCSASMNARTAGVSAFERAKSAAVMVAERLSADDRLTLIRVAAKPEEVFSRFSSDTAAIRAKIEELKTGPSRANFFAALTYVFGPVSGGRQPLAESANPVVYLFTDCQSTGWREAKSQGLDRLIPEATEVAVVNVGSSAPVPNLAMVGDAPRRHRGIVGLPITLYPRVANYSNTESVEAAVSVFIDEKEVARTTMTLKPGETGTRKVVYTPNEPGVLRGRFEVSGKARDAFPDDDSFLFTLSLVPRVKVLVVNGNPAAVDPFDSESLYVRAALTSTAEGSKSKVGIPAAAPPALPTPLPASAIETHEIPESALSLEALRDVSVVVLANCGGLNPQHFIWLRDFVAGGGGLIILPGDRVNPDIYNTQFFTVPGPVKEHITGVRLGPPEGEPEKVETFERLAMIDFAHPVLSVFDDPEARYLRTVRVYRRFPLKPEMAKEEKPAGKPTAPARSAAVNAWALAEFASGTPALVESRFGDGMVLLAAFPANTKWTNLPVKPEFVPLVLRMINHAQRRPDLEAPSVVHADVAAEIGIASSWAPVAGKVTDAAGRSAPLEFERSGPRLLGAFERTVEKGYYMVEVKGGRPEQPKTGTAAFAVNLAPEESPFDTLTENQLRDLLPAAQLTFVDASAEAQQLHGTIGKEQEIWRPLIWIVFAIMAIEFFLATLRGQRKETDESTPAADRIRQFARIFQRGAGSGQA